MAEQPPPLQIRHMDLPDLRETFADSIRTVVWDGQTLRIEFGVTRFSELKPNTPMEATRYPACRMVLSATAAADLANRLQQALAALKTAAAAAPKAQPGAPAPSPSADTPAATSS